MKGSFEKLVVAIGIPILIGSLSSILVGNSTMIYEQLNQPVLSPPGWVFPIVWSILYVLMGIASYLVVKAASGKEARKGLILYGAQLIVNFFWSIIFFQKKQYAFALLWLLFLWVLILLTIKEFYKISPLASYLMLPYFLWVTFAGYLNFGIALMN